MPDQKWCTWFNDRTGLSRAARDARAEHCQQRFFALRRIEERMEMRQLRQLRQAAMVRVLDGALLGACLVAVAVMAVLVGVS